MSINMEASTVAMEHLVGKLTTELETLRKENKTLKGATNEPKNDVEPSNNKQVGSRNGRGEGDTEEEMMNMQNELYNLEGKYEEMARKMSTSSLVD